MFKTSIDSDQVVIMKLHLFTFVASFAGCPFKHSDVDVLRLKFQGMSMPKEMVDDVSNLQSRTFYL